MPELLADVEFHLYQVDFTDSLLGSFNAFRFDPGDGAGIVLEVDYIRLGALTAAAKLSVALQPSGQVRVSWPAAAAGTLQSTTKLPGGWAADTAAVMTEGTTKYVEVPPSGTKFFRLSIQ